MCNVRVVPNGPIWRRHVKQIQPRYTSDDDQDPGDVLSFENDPPGALRDNDDQDSGDVLHLKMTHQKFQMHLPLQKRSWWC